MSDGGGERPQELIGFDHVFFSYDGVPVLENVCLTVGPREFISIVGPNGGGKTTLLKLLLGILKPQRGQIRVFGRTPTEVRHRIGYVPQYTRFDPQFPVTVLDVVLMGRLGTGAKWRYGRDDMELARASLDELGIADLERRPFEALSGGQRQRVLIARSLVSQPEILLLDEPTANVDIAVETKLIEILQRLNERLTILMVSHDVGFISTVVDTVVCVSREVVVHPTSELTGDLIQEVYGADIKMVRHDHRCSAQGHSHD